MQEKNLAIISSTCQPATALMPHGSDEFTRSMLTAINSMMLDMPAAIARKDHTDRRRRQQEGVKKSQREGGVYRGRIPDQNKARPDPFFAAPGKSISETARLAGVSERTVTRVSKALPSTFTRNAVFDQQILYSFIEQAAFRYPRFAASASNNGTS